MNVKRAAYRSGNAISDCCFLNKESEAIQFTHEVAVQPILLSCTFKLRSRPVSNTEVICVCRYL